MGVCFDFASARFPASPAARHLCLRLTAARLGAAEAPPVASGSVKNFSLLICTASAFSERYLGLPLRDDSRYQVRVYRLPSLCLPPISESLSDTPSVKPLRMLLSKSEAAMLCLFCFFLRRLSLCRIWSLIPLW